MNTLVVGLLRGDEGKGKICDYLADSHNVVVRYAGGPNAGHSIYRNNKLFVTHIIPSGIFSKKICIIGRGCVVNLEKLYTEYLDLCKFLQENNDSTFENPELEIKALLKLSKSAHIITKTHISDDTDRENSGKGNGSTKQGISPAYRDKYYRSGKRVIDIINYFDNQMGSFLNYDMYDFFKSIIIDEEEFINNNPHLNYLFEGAQGILLDIDNPYYPNVSSSSVSVGGVITGTGISYKNLMKDFSVTGIVKAYMSSVGVGEFLTEVNTTDSENKSVVINGYEYIEPDKKIRDVGAEYGATTGRPRKVGWLDIPLIKYSIRTTGVDNICLTRLDTLRESMKDYKYIPICVAYKHFATNNIIDVADLWNLDEYVPVYELMPIWKNDTLSDENFKKFIDFIESKINVSIKYISVGKNKDNIIEK
jgi:adenylosuccinate synthase